LECPVAVEVDAAVDAVYDWVRGSAFAVLNGA
jgi:hypothetical protein